jgi:DNA (cytosine-5)-methyltransferase 1
MNLTYNINAELLADIVSVSKSTLLKWENNGKLKPVISTAGKKQYQINQLTEFREIGSSGFEGISKTNEKGRLIIYN